VKKIGVNYSFVGKRKSSRVTLSSPAKKKKVNKRPLPSIFPLFSLMLPTNTAATIPSNVDVVVMTKAGMNLWLGESLREYLAELELEAPKEGYALNLTSTSGAFTV
jgi:hypothetical protein